MQLGRAHRVRLEFKGAPTAPNRVETTSRVAGAHISQNCCSRVKRFTERLPRKDAYCLISLLHEERDKLSRLVVTSKLPRVISCPQIGIVDPNRGHVLLRRVESSQVRNVENELRACD